MGPEVGKKTNDEENKWDPKWEKKHEKKLKAIRHRCCSTTKPLIMVVEREPCPVSY